MKRPVPAREQMARAYADSLPIDEVSFDRIADLMTERTGVKHTRGMVAGLIDRSTKREMREAQRKRPPVTAGGLELV